MADQAPNIFPFMRFADADAALEWLSRAFGFEQRVVVDDLRHAAAAVAGVAG